MIKFKKFAFLLCFSFVGMYAKHYEPIYSDSCLCYGSNACGTAQSFLGAYNSIKFSYENYLNNGVKKEELTHLVETYKDRLSTSCKEAKNFLKRDKLLFEVFLLDEYNMNYKDYQKLCKDEVNIQV